jgi:hypothetical protein
MKILQSAVLIAAGMVALGVMQTTAPMMARAMGGQTPQQMTPMPTPVPPDVIVTNEPTVNARQAGTWTFHLQGDQPLSLAPVHVAAPTFLEPGGQYAITWAPGAKPEVDTVTRVEAGGWALVSGEASQTGAIWINLAQAIRIEQVGAPPGR